MNLAIKTKWANVLTALASVIAIVQTFLTSPPFTPELITTLSIILTYAALLATTWKQYLSPEVSNTGGQVTIVIAIIATLTGAGDLIGIFHFSDHTGQYIKWGFTVLAAILSIVSKQLFPSIDQKDKMADLKLQK